ncbi:MAG: 5-formaminoimidazole-4-carboxamide-(beta)-D-ribofuranosyl 5-monophosphate synthetase [Thermoplasmata archaeon]|jgi:5-formaminoimidazole-4-carboxamide-1-(beta)-D-ribofuranosyl 5'-monophosphate synthetase|nr:5-formaminoimidazole-4-carboxamide-(beta)-D-ribofuranosyl 5-monophosphate synthetase [Thermoplasmata archaeon]
MGQNGGDLLAGYDAKDLTIATAVSHSSLQIFHGAKLEGFRTLAIAAGDRDVRYYDAFPRAKPDRMLKLPRYHDLLGLAEELREDNVVLVPHGSLVEYLGPDNYIDIGLPIYGNRKVLHWESNRDKQREWLEAAGIRMPRKIDDPKDIVEPVIVKYHGAKGGRGFFIAKSYHDFKRHIQEGQPYTIQEFILGTRYYLHYFFSPLVPGGFEVRLKDRATGQLQMLSIDRRDESNIDEMNRLGSLKDMDEIGIAPTFVVTGNIPMVIRESLLPEVFRMGEKVVQESYERFGGLWGPFCLETVVTDQLEFRVFEISARIVAGTNPFVGGSPYSEMVEPGLSTGRRIAQEIKRAAAAGRLKDILT